MPAIVNKPNAVLAAAERAKNVRRETRAMAGTPNAGSDGGGRRRANPAGRDVRAPEVVTHG